MYKRYVWLIILVICLVIPITASAAPDRYQWMFSDDKYGHFFDTQTIKYGYNQYSKQVDKTVINVWIKTVYTEDGIRQEIERRKNIDLPIKGFENLSYSLTNYIFTKDKKICPLQYIVYDKKGFIIDQETPSNQQWFNIIPGSLGESWHEEIWEYSSGKLNSLLMESETKRGK